MNIPSHRFSAALLAVLASVGCGPPDPDDPGPGVRGGPSIEGDGGAGGQAQAAVPVPPELLAEAERSLMAGDFDRVEELLAAHVSDERPSGRAELLFGLAHHKRKRYPAAEPWFEAAARVDGAWSGAESVPYFLGWCRYYLGDLEGAEAGFTEHRALDPDEGDTVFGLGVVALDLGEPERAGDLFGEAIALHERALAGGAQHLVPDLAKSWARLGDARSALGDLAGARDALQRCVELYPPFHVAWFRLGTVLRELGDEAGAERAFAEEQRWKAAAGR